MGHPLRWFLPGVVYELTTRTMQERFLLRPSLEARELILGVLGRGLVLYPNVKLHAFVFLSNHSHVLVSADDGDSLSGFIGYVNGRVGFEMGRLHGWTGHFWSRRGRPIPVLDGDAQVARLRYLIAQGCKEGLVASPREWPGASAVPGLLADMELEGWWFDRDQERRARKRGEEPGRYDHAIRYRVALSPLPVWAHLEADELRRRHELLVREVEEAGRQERLAEGRNALGVATILAQDAHARPAASKRSAAPLCHGSTHSIRENFRAAYRAFVSAFRQAAAVLRSLAPNAPMPAFPPGSFSPRLPSVLATRATWLSSSNRPSTGHPSGRRWLSPIADS